MGRHYGWTRGQPLRRMKPPQILNEAMRASRCLRHPECIQLMLTDKVGR